MSCLTLSSLSIQPSEQSSPTSFYKASLTSFYKAVFTLFHYKQCLYRRFAWPLSLFPTIIGPLVTYFESTWIFGTYPLELWNVYNCTVLGDRRTNNNSEGGNNAINLCFGTSSPIMPKFVEKLQLYNCKQETKLEQLFRCRNPNRVPRTSEVTKNIISKPFSSGPF